MTYNGWANWETWNLYNWISSDEGTYEAARDVVRGAEDPADALHQWIYDSMPELPASWYLDAILAAITAVDWREAAHALLED